MSAALVELGKNGIQSSMAGSGLRTALTKLASTSPVVVSALKDMGVSAFNAQGSFIGFPKLFDQLHAAQQRFGPDSKQFIGDLNEAFGQRAEGVMALFADKGGADYNRFLNIIEAGNVQKIADLQNRGVAAGFTQLGKEATAAGITIYDKFSPAIASIIDGLGTKLPSALSALGTILSPSIHLIGDGLGVAWRVAGGFIDVGAKALEAISGVLERNKTLVTALITAVGGIYAAFKIFTVVKSVISGVSDAFAALRVKAVSAGIAIREAGTETSSMSSASIAGSAAMAGLGVVIGVATYAWEKHQAQVQANQQAIEAYTTSVQQDSGAIGTNTLALVKSNLVKADAYQLGLQLGIGQRELTSAALGNSTALTKVNTVLRANFQSTGSKEIADRSLSATLGSVNSQLAKAVQNNHDMTAANGASATASTAASNAAKRQAAAVAAAAAAEKAAKAQAQALDTALQNLAQTQLAAAQSNDGFREGILNLTKTLDTNHDELNKNTTAGLANRDALLGMLSQAVGLAQAQQKNGQSIDSVTSSLKGNITQLEQTAIHAGLSKSAVHALVAQMDLTPKDITTKFDASTGTAMAALNQVVNKMTQIAQGVTGTVRIRTVQGNTVTTHGAQLGMGGGPHAAGGSVANGYFTVGEQGGHSDSWELGYKRGAQVQIFSNAQSKAMTGMSRVPGFAAGSGGTVPSGITTTTVGGSKKWVYDKIQYASLSAAENARTRDGQDKTYKVGGTSYDSVKLALDAIAKAMTKATHETLGLAAAAQKGGSDLKNSFGNILANLKIEGATEQQRARLTAIDDQAARLANQRLAAFAKVASLRQARASMVSKDHSAFTGGFALASAGTTNGVTNAVSTGSIFAQAKQSAIIAEKMSKGLIRLRKEGLALGEVQQLAEGGLSSYPQVEALLKATPKQLAQLDGYESTISGAGSRAGNYLGGQKYDGQIRKGREVAHKDSVALGKKLDDLEEAVRELAKSQAEHATVVDLHVDSRKLATAVATGSNKNRRRE